VPSRIAVHFDLAKGQTPENIALSPDGTAYVTFAAARQIAMVTKRGTTRILATLPAPADGGVDTPVLKFALTTGIVRTDDGTLYFLYAGGSAQTTGLYRLRAGGTPTRVAALPATGLPNGLALDERSKTFYITDSVLGTISTVPLGGHRATVWSSAPQLASTGFIGVNGVKVRDGAVWVSNLDKGTLMRIPLRQGRPGPIKVKAEGLTGIDDFAFAGDQVIATLHGIGSVVRVGPDGKATTLLTASDGLQNPTSVAVRGRTLHVLSAAYTTATDPNLLLATLPRH
jgi:sugar lactone lactonase YvrE